MNLTFSFKEIARGFFSYDFTDFDRYDPKNHIGT